MRPALSCLPYWISISYIYTARCSRFKPIHILWNWQPFQSTLQYWTSASVCKSLDPNWGASRFKSRRKVKLGIQNEPLREDSYYQEIEQQLKPLQISIKQQGDIVRTLKNSQAPKDTIKNEVRKLKSLNKELEKLRLSLSPSDTIDLARMEDLVKRKFYYTNSFDIYGGSAGQYDYGPLGCQIVENLLHMWHQHFVVQEGMMKVSCPCLTPAFVLKATGHVHKFVDTVVKDESSGEMFRLDQLMRAHLTHLEEARETGAEELQKVREAIPRLDSMSKEELWTLAEEFRVQSPTTGGSLSQPFEMNLMFPVVIGSSVTSNGFLRPETAQGIFTNFKKLLALNGGHLPFACAQVGVAFRNELTPKTGLLRVREFTLAEIEHFCAPDTKTHPKFDQVCDIRLWLFSACDQLDGTRPRRITIREAVREGLVANETLGFYLARTQLFLVRVGLDPRRVRFRQHLSTEMAHYARDCWDAECLTSHGWVECVGVADRAAHDLSSHMDATGVDLCVEGGREEGCLAAVINETALRQGLGVDGAARVRTALRQMDPDDLRRMDTALDASGSCEVAEGFVVTRAMVPQLKEETKVVPSVVEPSFGIGRIFYSLLEHTFRVREDDRRTFFSLPPTIAPVSAAVLAVVDLPKFEPVVRRLQDALKALGVPVWSGEVRGTLGRQYVHMDEMAVPLCVTVDEGTLVGPNLPNTVTLRERDSTLQARIPVDAVASVVKNLTDGSLDWPSVLLQWPKVDGQSPPSPE